MQIPIRFRLKNKAFKHGFSTALCGTLLMTSALAQAQTLPRLLPGTQPLATLLPALSRNGSDGSTQSRATGTSAGLPLIGGLLGGGSQAGNRTGNQGFSLGQPTALLGRALAPLPGLENTAGSGSDSNGSERSAFSNANNDSVDGDRNDESNFRFSRRDEFDTDRLRISERSGESGDESGDGSGNESSASGRQRLNASGFNAIDFQSNRSSRSETDGGDDLSGDSSSQASLQLDSGLQVTRRAEGQSSSDSNSGGNSDSDSSGNSSSDNRDALAISSSMTIERGSSQSSNTQSSGSGSGN